MHFNEYDKKKPGKIFVVEVRHSYLWSSDKIIVTVDTRRVYIISKK